MRWELNLRAGGGVSQEGEGPDLDVTHLRAVPSTPPPLEESTRQSRPGETARGDPNAQLNDATTSQPNPLEDVAGGSVSGLEAGEARVPTQEPLRGPTAERGLAEAPAQTRETSEGAATQVPGAPQDTDEDSGDAGDSQPSCSVRGSEAPSPVVLSSDAMGTEEGPVEGISAGAAQGTAEGTGGGPARNPMMEGSTAGPAQGAAEGTGGGTAAGPARNRCGDPSAGDFGADCAAVGVVSQQV